MRLRPLVYCPPRAPVRFLVRAVSLDLDGTLLDSAPDLATAIDAMLARLDLAPLGVARVRGMIGGGVTRLVRKALEAAGATATADCLTAALRIFHEAYGRELGTRSRPYPGVPGTLSILRERGFRLACVADQPARYALPLLDRLGLADGLDLIVGSDSVRKAKPDPLPLLHVATRFGTEPAAMLHVGDSTTDLLAARAAGCPFLAHSAGYADNPAALLEGADSAVLRLAEALPFLGQPAG